LISFQNYSDAKWICFTLEISDVKSLRWREATKTKGERMKANRQQIWNAINIVQDFVRAGTTGVSLNQDPHHNGQQVMQELCCAYLEAEFRKRFNSKVEPGIVQQINNMKIAEESARVSELVETAYNLQRQAIGLD